MSILVSLQLPAAPAPVKPAKNLPSFSALELPVGEATADLFLNHTAAHAEWARGLAAQLLATADHIDVVVAARATGVA